MKCQPASEKPRLLSQTCLTWSADQTFVSLWTAGYMRGAVRSTLQYGSERWPWRAEDVRVPSVFDHRSLRSVACVWLNNHVNKADGIGWMKDPISLNIVTGDWLTCYLTVPSSVTVSTHSDLLNSKSFSLSALFTLFYRTIPLTCFLCDLSVVCGAIGTTAWCGAFIVDVILCCEKWWCYYESFWWAMQIQSWIVGHMTLVAELWKAIYRLTNNQRNKNRRKKKKRKPQGKISSNKPWLTISWSP